MPITREQLFGADLKLIEPTAGLDLKLDSAGDLELAEDNENIIQALKLHLLVAKGELAPLGWPEFGSRLDELIGQPNNTRTRAMAAAFARQAIEQDPRVAKVLDVRVSSQERATVRIAMQIQLIDQQHPLNLVHLLNLEAS